MVPAQQELLTDVIPSQQCDQKELPRNRTGCVEQHRARIVWDVEGKTNLVDSCCGVACSILTIASLDFIAGARILGTVASSRAPRCR
jgi:hypothetical protein